MAEHTISAKVHAAFAALHGALTTLVPPVRVHHEIDFEWRTDTMDINIAATSIATPGPMDYLITGWISGEPDDAIARCSELARALECAGIPFQIELEDENSGAELCVLRYGAFE